MSNEEYNPIIEFQEIDAFVKQMKKKIVKNSHKRNIWMSSTIGSLLSGLDGEYKELDEARHTDNYKNMQDELIDIANFCMFIWSRLKSKS